MATLIQIRRDTQANWTSNNPVLALGELAYSIDEQKLKVGDGSSAWSSLSYINSLPSEITAEINSAIGGLVDGSPETLNTLNELAAAINDDPNFFANVFKFTASVAKPSTSNVGDGWLDLETGNLYFYINDGDSSQWVEV